MKYVVLNCAMSHPVEPGPRHPQAIFQLRIFPAISDKILVESVDLLEQTPLQREIAAQNGGPFAVDPRVNNAVAQRESFVPMVAAPKQRARESYGSEAIESSFKNILVGDFGRKR